MDEHRQRKRANFKHRLNPRSIAFVGSGGVMTELLGDSAHPILPVNEDQVKRSDG